MAGEVRYSIGVSSAELSKALERVRELEHEVEVLRAKVLSSDTLFREYEQVKLVVFQLTTEYRGSQTKIENEESRQKITILTNKKYKELQSLRKRFYYHLHGVAYRTRAGWVVFRDLPTEKLENVIAKINQAIEDVTGEKEAVTILETLMPKKFLAGELKKYIAELKEKLRKTREKIERLRELSSDSEEIGRSIARAEREREAIMQLLAIAEEELHRYAI